MAEKLPPYEEWKLDNPGYSKTYYDQLKHIEEGGTISGSSKANPDEFIMIEMGE